MQLTTVRYLSLFLADPLDVPNAVLEYLAEQLAVADPFGRQALHRTPIDPIRARRGDQGRPPFGLRDFADGEPELTAWVDARAWTTATAPRPPSPTQWPGCSTAGCCCGSRPWPGWWPRCAMRRCAALGCAVRAAHGQAAGGARTPVGRSRWGSLLGSGALAQAPALPSGKNLAKALTRVSEITAVGLGKLDLDVVVPRRRAGTRPPDGWPRCWGPGRRSISGQVFSALDDRATSGG